MLLLFLVVVMGWSYQMSLAHATHHVVATKLKEYQTSCNAIAADVGPAFTIVLTTMRQSNQKLYIKLFFPSHVPSHGPIHYCSFSASYKPNKRRGKRKKEKH